MIKLDMSVHMYATTVVTGTPSGTPGRAVIRLRDNDVNEFPSVTLFVDRTAVANLRKALEVADAFLALDDAHATVAVNRREDDDELLDDELSRLENDRWPDLGADQPDDDDE